MWEEGAACVHVSRACVLAFVQERAAVRGGRMSCMCQELCSSPGQGAGSSWDQSPRVGARERGRGERIATMHDAPAYGQVQAPRPPWRHVSALCSGRGSGCRGEKRGGGAPGDVDGGASDELPHHDAEGVDVALAVQLQAAHDLWRRVEGRALADAARVALVVTHAQRHAKVADLRRRPAGRNRILEATHRRVELHTWSTVHG